MPPVPRPDDEDARLAALAAYGLQPGRDRAGLSEIVALAARLLAVPVALVSIVDRDRQWFEASVGTALKGTARAASFCTHAIAQDGILVVNDALRDARFRDSPFVLGDPFIRFYAGVPLRTPDGHAIGALCMIDHRPRDGLSATERTNLLALAAIVTDRLELQRTTVAGRTARSRFENIAATSPDGILCADQDGRITFWNTGCERLFGHAAADVLGAGIDIIVPQRMRGGHVERLQRAAASGRMQPVDGPVELEAAHRDGREFPIELSLSMWREDGRAGFGAIIRDVSARRANETRLFNLAHLDGLTALPNRSVLLDRIAAAAAAAEPLAVLMLDLDGFKAVNDTQGHEAGDAVLREVARRIRGCMRPGDTVARLGGDEFAILLPGGPKRGRAGALADRLIAAIGAPYRIDGRVADIGVSIGIAFGPDDGAQGEELMAAADLAMYRAKHDGRNRRRFFDAGLRDAVTHRRAFEGEMRRALDAGEFELFYQPQVRMADGALLGVEALLRWRHPVHGLLAPAAFLAAIESGPLAPDIGRWVLETACAQAVALRAAVPGLVMGVNLFGAQFRTGRLAEEVTAVLARTGLAPAALELEITETVALRHDDTMPAALHALAQLGVGIAFDNFGTGFASLSLLKRYPLTRLKIDRGVVRDICTDRMDAAMVNALILLGGRLGLEVVAEGIETEDQRDLLRGSGCTAVQGYLYGRPMPIADLDAFIHARTTRREDHRIAA